MLIQRKAGYYFWKILLPLFVITNISWVIFLMPSFEVGSRIAVVVGVLFTSVSFLRVAEAGIPKVQLLQSSCDPLLLYLTVPAVAYSRSMLFLR